jgi:LuxR family transcriptional regulator, maltose regulon positive regulatory protein
MAERRSPGGVPGAAARSERSLRVMQVPESSRAGPAVPIETKFHAPALREKWVERAGLVQSLAGATAAKLVLVEAPAGFGKTTLVAQWRAGTLESRPFAWISLDRGDNDPATLWWYISHALRRACPGLGSEPVPPDRPVEEREITGILLPGLINDLDALAAPVVLALDDYQDIIEPRCHEQISFLLQHLPSSAQIVLITRTAPPLPLAALRAAGDMIEIRGPALRFSAAEAALLVEAISGVHLGESDLAVLVERTEGWPAGLYLAALSLRGQPSPGAFVREFTGDNRFITDFLAEEVLSRQPAEIRQFLARTSILSRFCAPLCAAVVGTTNTAEIIDLLDRENLFIVPLDEFRQWFRYHRLFAQVLGGYLRRTDPEVVPVLHERASAWHRQWGSVDEAIEHALAGGDHAAATGLLASHWYGYVDSGRLVTLRSWIGSLDYGAIGADPVAAHCAAWAAALAGDRELVRHCIPVMEAAGRAEPLPDGMRSLKSSVALLRGLYGFEGYRVMRDSAALAVELEDDPATPWYALARVAFGFSRYLSGEPGAAEGPLEQAISSGPAIRLVRMLALSVLSLVAVDMGQLARARELARAALSLGAPGGVVETQASALAHLAAGAVYAARGQLAEARRELEHAVEFREMMPGISPWATVEAIASLAQVLLAMGDRSGAAALLDQQRLLVISLADPPEALKARLERLERQAAGRRSASLDDPLTEREVAVLRQLQSPLSLREIGQELHLSANTIKTHVQAIYRKLGVSTRHDAVAQGRETGIL